MNATEKNWDATRAMLQAVAAGQLDVDAALRRCQSTATESIAGATLDLGRAARCGFGEVIYGPGKSAELIQQIARRLLQCQAEVLVTRCAAEAAHAIASQFAHHRYQPRAQTLRLSDRPIDPPSMLAPPSAAQPAVPPAPALAAKRPATGASAAASVASAGLATAPAAADERAPGRSVAGSVAVVTAGSTDAAVAEEAAETLAWMGVAVDWIEDVGVAGPQRLLAVVDRLRAAAAIVVVAGMEGALPSVVAGHVACPVIAVPTSVGYGAALAGLTPLLAMLTSCAANVAVVNIDAGFKGGYVAGMIAAGKEDR